MRPTSQWPPQGSDTLPRFLGQIGSDAIGSAMLAEMAADGVDVAMVRRAGSTGMIVALVDPTGERSMLTDRRACIDLSDPDPSWLDGVDILHVPLYSLATGALAATTTTVVGWAHDRDIEVSIDVSSSAVILDMGIDRVRHLLADLHPAVILANRDEAITLDIDRPLADAVTIVKQGPNPAVVYSPNRDAVEAAGIVVPDVGDTTGAGDAFAAGFLTHLDGWRSDPVAACASGHRCAAALLTSRAGR